METCLKCLLVWCNLQFLGFILNDPLSEITTTLVVGYGCYVLAESTGYVTVLTFSKVDKVLFSHPNSVLLDLPTTEHMCQVF